MNLGKIQGLFVDLENYLKKYVDNSIRASYRIVVDTVEILSSELSDDVKRQTVICNYKKLFPGKGALSEFYVWDNDFETRKNLNKPFESIHNELWLLVKDYI